MTTIALYSDLHLELQYRPAEWLTTVPDILILAGDISYLDRVDLFLVELIDRYSELQIVFIAGNHEYYGSQYMQEAENKLKASLAAYDRIHFLQCDTRLTPH
jgi:metallophosphoesterase superfamily enzyme